MNASVAKWLSCVAMVALPAWATPPLSVYADKYPGDPSLSLPFLEHPIVRHAIERVVPDPDIRRWLVDPAGPKTPIWIKDGRIHSWGCEAHFCGPHNWMVSMTLNGADPAVCYHNAQWPDEGATWFVEGRTEIRQHHCPASAEDLPH